MHKSAAWPLALIYVGLVVYASLYPFADWRDQGIAPWVFLAAPMPRYWTGFDLAINSVGYAPLGGLLSLGVIRSGRMRHVIVLPVLVASLLAFAMEMLQSYLPSRIPSREDWLLNTPRPCALVRTAVPWWLGTAGIVACVPALSAGSPVRLGAGVGATGGGCRRSVVGHAISGLAACA
jgi:VanZ family protein